MSETETTLQADFFDRIYDGLPLSLIKNMEFFQFKSIAITILREAGIQINDN